MVFIAFLAGVAAFYAFQYFPYLTVLSSASAFIFLGKRKNLLIIGIALVGAVYALIRGPYDHPIMPGTQAEIIGVIRTSPLRTSEGSLQEIKIESIRDVKNNKSLDINQRVLAVFSDKEFEHGRRYRLKARLYMSEGRLNPGDYPKKPYAVLEALMEEKDLSFIETARAHLNAFIKERFDHHSASLIMAITTGERGYMSNELKEAFNSTGLTHLLSISGTHFALLSILLFGVSRILIRLLPYGMLERITVYITPMQAASILTIPFMLFYLGISGGSIPAIRSFVMISLFLGGLIIGRKGYHLHFLLFAAVLLVLWEPEVIYDLSFLMSFSACLFIGFFAGTRIQKESVKRYPLNTVLITLTAAAGVAPFVAYYFHRLSLISPLTNLIITPFVGFILLPISLIGAFSYIITGSFLMTPVVSSVSDFSIYLVEMFASIPYSDIRIPGFPVYIIIFYYACFVIYAAFKKKYLLALPFILILVYSVYAAVSPRALTVTFLAPSRGDSAVIELPDEKTIVVDAGKSGKETAAYLNYRALEEVNALMISHGHDDHAGGMGYLINNFRVKEIWDNGEIPYDELLVEGIKHKTLKRGDFIEGPGYGIYAFHPYKGFYTSSGNSNTEENNNSLVFKLKGRNGFLFTGDIEEEAEDDIAHLGKWLKSDVLKVPHHGSVSSIHSGFFNAVSPQVAIITSKRLNPKMKEALNGARIYLTGIEGAIKIEDVAGGPSAVKPYTDSLLKKTGRPEGEIKNIKRLFVTW